MGANYYATCKQCQSAWEFFRCQAGGMSVDPLIVSNPLQFWEWMQQHIHHEITVLNDDGLNDVECNDVANRPSTEWVVVNRLPPMEGS